MMSLFTTEFLSSSLFLSNRKYLSEFRLHSKSMTIPYEKHSDFAI